MHLQIDPPTGAVVTPPVFMAFDCLDARGRDIRAEPLKDRRKRLEDEINARRSSQRGKVRREGRFRIGGIAATASGYRGLLLGMHVGRE
jgi:hypothetical protein